MTVKERLEFYVNSYDLIGGGLYGVGPQKKIGDPTNRLCRFCEKGKDVTTFRNVAHAIPECLGNKQLILLDECDTCNKFFSETLEDHLDKFTKPFRTIAQIKGKRSVPSYKSRDKKSRVDFDRVLKMTAQIDSHFIQDNDTNNQFVINMDMEPYVPAAVYKALVKIALSIIEDRNELPAFKHTIEWIRDPDHSRMMIKPLTMLVTFIPGPNPNVATTTMLFRKKEGTKVPHSLFLLAFGNFIYQIIVPSHFDARSGETLTCSLPFFPSPFDIDWPYGQSRYGITDLSNHQRVLRSVPLSMHYDQKIEIPVQNKGEGS